MSTSFTAINAALRRRDGLVKPMSENRRLMAALASVAMFLGACSAPTGTAVATPSRSAAPRPGLILFEHVGNGADGTQLADTEQRHLWLVKADGSNLHELAPGQPTEGKGAAAWSPDGRHIAFEAQGEFTSLIYETDIDGTNPRLISTECAKDPERCLEFLPAYSANGMRMAFVRMMKTSRITDQVGVIGIRDLATGKVTLLKSTRQGPPKAELSAPAWSPDGTQLVYYKVAKDADGRPTGSSEMFVVNEDGSGLHALKTPGLAAGDPDWSPDGSLIVFSTEPIHEWNDAGVADHPDVYTIHPDGTGLKQLTFDQGSGAPSWTSDGKILYFSQRGLWLMDADGSDQTQVPLGMDLVSQTTGYSYYSYWQPMP
jgi:Tol biopolymer transport system component